MSINIFDEAKEKAVPTWAKFTEEGDQYQGTYIGKIVGQVDGYGNEQIIYQLLQEDGSVINVGFGLNKKALNQDMLSVKFGQIIGFRYKGKVSFKDKFGKTAEVKDFGLHQDPKIVDEKWLAENKDNMPKVINVAEEQKENSETKSNFNQFVSDVEKENMESDDVPFSSEDSLTKEDQLAVIEKLAKDKLGALNSQEVKEKVMEATSIAFIPVNYKKITEALAAL